MYFVCKIYFLRICDDCETIQVQDLSGDPHMTYT